MTSKLTPEEMGKNLEDIVDDLALLDEARGLGKRTKADLDASISLSPEDSARAEEMGRRANEAFAKARREREAEGPVKPAPAIAVIEPPSRSPARWMLPLGLAAGFAMTAAFEGSAILAWIEGPVNLPQSQDASAPHQRAEELVAEAREDYNNARWADCVIKISNATSLEPALSRNPQVTEMKRMAEQKLYEESLPKVDAEPKRPK